VILWPCLGINAWIRCAKYREQEEKKLQSIKSMDSTSSAKIGLIFTNLKKFEVIKKFGVKIHYYGWAQRNKIWCMISWQIRFWNSLFDPSSLLSPAEIYGTLKSNKNIFHSFTHMKTACFKGFFCKHEKSKVASLQVRNISELVRNYLISSVNVSRVSPKLLRT
jgi:hypothetical protein